MDPHTPVMVATKSVPHTIAMETINALCVTEVQDTAVPGTERGGGTGPCGNSGGVQAGQGSDREIALD